MDVGKAPGSGLGGSEAAKTRLVLASASPARADLLAAAGLSFDIEPANVDEEEMRSALRKEEATAARVAEVLAELKARRVAGRRPGSLVIGADQVLEFQGAWFDKPVDLARARAQLLALRGKTHRLYTFACVVQEGARLWQHLDRSELFMRQFSDEFADAYLAAVGADAMRTVGAYRIEGLGAQLFSRIRGDFYSILGLPLLPLLEFLRGNRIVAT